MDYTGLKVLIIDDDKQQLDLYKLIFDKLKINILGVSKLFRIEEHIQSFNPNILLVNLNLESNPLAGLKVKEYFEPSNCIIYSSKINNDIITQCNDVGFFMIVEKPTTTNKIVKYIDILWNINQVKIRLNSIIDTKYRAIQEQDILLNSMNAATYIKDRDFKYTSVNKAFTDMMEYSRKEIIGKTDKALDLFNSLLPRLHGKEKSFVLKQIALIHLEQKSYEEANRFFIDSLEEDRNDYQSLYFAGYTSEIIGDPKSAKNYYNEILLLTRDFLQVFKRLAIVYFEEKEYEKSMSTIESIPPDKRDIDYYRIKSAVYIDQELYDKGIDVLTAGQGVYPNSEDLLFDQAIIYEKLKNYDECINILRGILKISPENSSVLNFLGYLYADLNINLDEAYILIDKALKSEPDNEAYIDSMAWVLYRLKRYEEAYSYQKKALKLFPDEVEFVEHMKAILKAMNSKKTIDEIINEM